MINKLLKAAIDVGIETTGELIGYLRALDAFREYPAPVLPLGMIADGVAPLSLDRLINKGLLRRAFGSNGHGLVPRYQPDGVFDNDEIVSLLTVLKNVTQFTNEDRVIVWLCLIDDDVFLYGYGDVSAKDVQAVYGGSPFVEGESNLALTSQGKLVKNILNTLTKSNKTTPYGSAFLKLLTWAGVNDMQSISSAVLTGLIQQHPEGLTRKEIEVELAKVYYPLANLPTRITRLGVDVEFVKETRQKRNGNLNYKAQGCPVNPYPLRYHLETLLDENVNNVRELMMVYMLGTTKLREVRQAAQFFKQHFGIRVDSSFVKRMYDKDLFLHWPEFEIILTLSPKGERLFELFK